MRLKLSQTVCAILSFSIELKIDVIKFSSHKDRSVNDIFF